MNLKPLIASVLLAGALSLSPNFANAKVLEPGVYQKGDTLYFSTHPLLVNDYLLSKHGGVINGTPDEILEYKQQLGPLVGVYCYGGFKGFAEKVMCKLPDSDDYTNVEDYLDRLGLKHQVRYYDDNFQDRSGNQIVAIIGCTKETSHDDCMTYIP